jgi:hypothetical protein
MDFTIFPFVMIALCAVMMVLTMRGMGPQAYRSSTRERDL